MPEPTTTEVLTSVRDAAHGARRTLLTIMVPTRDADLREAIEAARHHLLLGALRLGDVIGRAATDAPAIAPGQQLRAYREAAGLSREDLALGLETAPVAISARSRAELIGSIEDGVTPVSPELLGELLALVATLGAAVLDAAAEHAPQVAA